jgi:hypothetical protein
LLTWSHLVSAADFAEPLAAESPMTKPRFAKQHLQLPPTKILYYGSINSVYYDSINCG